MDDQSLSADRAGIIMASRLDTTTLRKSQNADDFLNEEEELFILEPKEPFNRPLLADRHDDLLSKIIGRKLSMRYQRLVWLKLCLLLLWMVAHCLSLLAFFGVAPNYVCWSSILGYITMLHTFISLDTELTKKLVFNFEVWFLSILSTLWFASIITIFKDKARRCELGLVWIGFIYVIFSDANINKNGKGVIFIRAGILFGIIFQIIFMTCLHFGIFTEINSYEIDMSISSGVTISTNIIMFTNQRLLTVLFFFSKNLIFSWRAPSCYMVLKAKIENKIITRSDLIKRIRREKNEDLNLQRISSINKTEKNKSRKKDAAVVPKG